MDGLFGPSYDMAALEAVLASRAATADRDALIQFHSLSSLKEAGVFGLTVPAALGGGGAALVQAAGVVRQLARGCPSTALITAMQLIHTHQLARNPACPAPLRDLVVRSAVGRGALINALRVEPALGSPSRGGLPETIARRTPDGWRISGHKLYATGSGALDWLLVWLRTDEDAPRTGYVLVPATAPGISIVETWDQLGLRASGSHDMVFRDVLVPLDNAVDLRAPADWADRGADQAAWNGLLIAALYTGVAEAARNWVMQFLQTRVPSGLGAPLSTLPRMQEQIGQIETWILANRRLVQSAAVEADAQAATPAHEYMAIQAMAVENAIAAVQRAVELTGNHGLSRANPLERHLRDVLCGRVHAPQPDLVRTTIGRTLLQTQPARQGEPA